MPWARASSLARHLECQAASHLPRFNDSTGAIKAPFVKHPAETLYALRNPSLLEVRPKKAADLGRLRHAEKERGELHPELWTGMARGHHEVTVSYCVLTGKVRWMLHANEHARDLWKAMQCEHSVVGTADWMGILADGTPWVDDLKTGWQTPEVVTAQLLFYALCLSELRLDRSSFWGAAAEQGPVSLSITHQPRGQGTPTRDGLWRRVSPLDLEAFRGTLTDAYRMIKLSDLSRAGAHCQWCPSAAWCDAALG
jgi:hypothetical protein